jgi:methylenetetrahydrofolate reductase (NADPH)
MPEQKTGLLERIESGEPILAAEVSPPLGADPAPVREMAKRFAGKVHALGVCDNRDRVGMSALVAAVLVRESGVEPILHVVTRDRNRVALVSHYLGALAMGIRNVLCTTGTHQTLGRPRSAKNVFDLDSIQMLRAYASLAAGRETAGDFIGEQGVNGHGVVCLGGVASPYADPLELQVTRLAKKVAAGARFLITDPVFDLERFDRWWQEVTRRGLHEQVAFLAGIHVLVEAGEARAYAARRPDPRVPEAVLARIESAGNGAAQRATGIEIAVETIKRLRGTPGLRGFQVCGTGDPDAALEVIEDSELGTD